MTQTMMAALFGVGLFVGMLILFEIGVRVARARAARDPEGSRTGTGVVEGAVFALLGLLIAFTFSGAMSRFEARRALINEEVNDIGTAYLRLDLLAAPERDALRAALRGYVDDRLALYRQYAAHAGQNGPHGIKTVADRLAQIQSDQQRIWDLGVAGSKAPDASADAAKLLLPALNDMFDIATTRTLATELHPPVAIWLALMVLALAAALMAGDAMSGQRQRSLLHELGFATLISLMLYLIVDIEYPRIGLIRVDNFDHALVELRNGMD